MTILLERPDTVVPSEKDAELATESSRILSKRVGGNGELRVRLDDGQVLTLPGAAARLLSHMLAEMSHGNAVTLIPLHAEFTTQEAADYLNVSRPHVVHLLEKGAIQYRKVGTHRRVKFQALQDYKRQTERNHDEIMKKLTAEAQELGEY